MEDVGNPVKRHICIYICARTYLNMSLYIYTYIHTYMYTCIHILVHLHLHILDYQYSKGFGIGRHAGLLIISRTACIGFLTERNGGGTKRGTNWTYYLN